MQWIVLGAVGWCIEERYEGSAVLIVEVLLGPQHDSGSGEGQTDPQTVLSGITLLTNDFA